MEKTQSNSMKPIAMITICKYYIKHSKVSIYCAPLAPQWKAKSQVYLYVSWAHLILKK